MKSESFARAALGVALATALGALLPSAAFGHAAFAGASPAPGTRVEVAPQRLTLLFTEPLNRRLSSASLHAVAGGAKLRVRRAPSSKRQIVLVSDRPLPRGAYRVDWHSVSTEDSHPLEGSFGFGVRAAAGEGSALEQRPLAGGGWLRALARATMYAALLVFAGALLAFALLGRDWVAPQEGSDPSWGIEARARSLLGDLGLVAAALAALTAVVDAADAAQGLNPSRLADFLLGGFSGIARIGAVAAIGVATALARRRPRIAAAAGAYALACVAGSGHANSADPRVGALAADTLHLLGAAGWLGAPAFLLAVWAPALRVDGAAAREALMRDVLPRVGRLALPAFALVVVTGTLSLLIEIGDPSRLFHSSYGTALLVKIGLVALIAVLSGAHVRARARGDARRHLRALRAEPAVAVGVLGAVALLAVFPLPPRQLDRANGALAAVPGCDPCPLPPPAADELPVAAAGGTRVVAAYVRRRGGALSGSIRVLDLRGRLAPGPIAVAGGRTRPCGPGCATFSLPGAPARLAVTVRDRGRPRTALLPTRWDRRANARAAALVSRAERTMRGLRSVREFERVSSGPGTLAITRYRLAAPDRYAFVTGGGVRTVGIGDTLYQRVGADPWRGGRSPDGPFRFESWWRYTPYARASRLLGERTERGRRVVEVAFADTATPVWQRLVIDAGSGRVLREGLVARARFITRSFAAFDRPLRIEPPRGVIPNG
jgi:putative copper export protein/methionine-rich copper-binding protein CopC